MQMIKLKIRREIIKGVPRSVKISADDYAIVGQLAKTSIQDNINQQMQADGSSLKANAPSTARRKELENKPVLSLVDEEHRFIQPDSFSATVVDERVTIEPGNEELKDLSRQVQEKGYTGWFGLNATAEKAVRVTMRNAIKRLFGGSGK
jgi:hypothetical protein